MDPHSSSEGQITASMSGFVYFAKFDRAFGLVGAHGEVGGLNGRDYLEVIELQGGNGLLIVRNGFREAVDRLQAVGAALALECFCRSSVAIEQPDTRRVGDNASTTAEQTQLIRRVAGSLHAGDGHFEPATVTEYGGA